MLDEKEVLFFKTLYHKWHPTSPTEFYKSYFSDNLDYKKEVEDAIIKYCYPKIENYFVDFEAFGAMFVVKPQGDAGHIPPHQDWSFVDETKHWSLNMWLPIQDVSERNGSMRFLCGSQFFLETIRGAETPQLYDHLEQDIEMHLEDVPLKAGQAVFFYHGVVHCSHYNEKAQERICLGLSVLQKNAPVYFHYLKPGEERADKYCVNTSFFIHHSRNYNQMPPDALYMGKDERPFKKLTRQELYENMAALKTYAQ
ncbi:MAG TPA: phytanoyl-CoA dioxygenase family protein [Chitinophagales bacterium]|nr:phytanoyl-CoA dioxygenase family protein [Chitinophagales bacterium]